MEICVWVLSPPTRWPKSRRYVAKRRRRLCGGMHHTKTPGDKFSGVLIAVVGECFTVASSSGTWAWRIFG